MLNAIPVIGWFISACVAIRFGTYTPSRVKSMRQATTTPVATNASFVSPAFIRNADRSAPCIPDSPPKKPLSTPPSGRYRGPNVRSRV